MNKTTSNMLENQGQVYGMVGVIRLFVHGKLEKEFPIGTDPLVIGRSPECDIVLSDSSIGRRHAKVIACDGVAVVKDLGSAHGIQVDGQTIKEHEIRSQGHFSILQYQFTYMNAMDYNMERKKPDSQTSAAIGAPEAMMNNAMKSGYDAPNNDYYYGARPGSNSLVEGSTFLAEAIRVVREKWRLIAISLVVALLVGLIHGFLAVPTYVTNALVQVEPKIREIGGPFSDFENTRRVNDALVDEIEVVQSRSVLGEVVDNLGLAIQSSPTYFPFVGAAISRTRKGDGSVAAPLLGLKQYSWSNESVAVESMEIPDRFLWQEFKIVAGGNGAFKVLDLENNTMARGNVGEAIVGWLPSDEPSSLFVSELSANPGAVFRLRKIPRIEAIAGLRLSLGITDAGLDSSMLRLSYPGADPTKIANIVNSVLTSYVAQNVRKQSENATRTLTFVEKQIPIAKEKMESAEAMLNELRLERGSVDLSRDTQVVLERIVTLESQASTLQSTRAELMERFTPQHPRVRSVDAQLRDVNQRLAVAESRVRELPTTEREVLSISREVAVASALYVSLVNRAQELQVVSAYAATTGNVRVVDYASLPIFPFRPNKPFLLVIYLMLAVLFSGGLILFQRQLRNVIRDPEQIEARLNLPIYATLAHSSRQDSLGNQGTGLQTPILAMTNPTDSAIEPMPTTSSNSITRRSRSVALPIRCTSSGSRMVCATVRRGLNDA